MLKKIGVVGALGNMGQRYCKILDYLKVEHVDIDLGINPPTKDCDGFIVATSTHSHLKIIRNLYYQNGNVPILCEKPLSIIEHGIKDLWGLRDLPSLNLQMINQYKYLNYPRDYEGHTSYNFFKTGKDSLAWDCISILALAKSSVKLKNDSPLWSCQINGAPVSIADMDMAYVKNIEDWLENPKPDLNYIVHAHSKVVEYLNDKCPDRNTST